MIVSPRGLLTDIGQRFTDTARSALPGVGTPSWFAPPVDVRGDAESVTILFYLPESIATPHVEVSGSSLLLRARLPAGNGGERAHCGIRVFALPFETSQRSPTTSRANDILRVHVRCLHPDARKLPLEVPLEEEGGAHATTESLRSRPIADDRGGAWPSLPSSCPPSR